MPGALRILNTANRWVEMGTRVKRREPVNPLELIDLGLHTLFGEDTARDVKSQGTTLLNTILFGSDVAIDEPTYDGVPWASLARTWKEAPFLVCCIYGDPGAGKSQLLIKQAATVHQERGWPVDVLGFYPEDMPPFARHISMKRLIARIRKVLRYVDQETEEDIDDGITEADIRGKKPATTPTARITDYEIDQMKHRFIGVDEAAAFFSSLGAAGQSETRDASKRWADAIRHMKSHLYFICQKQSDAPAHVRASALNVYKWASKGVIAQDFKPGSKRDTMEKWILALTMLNAVKTGSYVEPLPNFMDDNMKEAIHRAAAVHDTYWVGPLADIRAWGVAIGNLSGREFLTVFPFTRWQPPALLSAGGMDN